jgi:23S rRNA (uracil1939-C5)-methyltransferase
VIGTGSVATLDIEKVVAGGDGLARHDSLVVFTPRTLDGELVRARVTVKGRLARGTLLGLERASSERVSPACPHYEGDACGGCQLQHASYAEQLRIKGRIVADAMRRIAHRVVEEPPVHPSANAWRYRSKLTLAIRRDRDGWYAGLRRFDDPDSVFQLRVCLITADRVVALWRDVMAASDHFPGAQELRGAVRVERDGAASFMLEGGDRWPGAAAFFERVGVLRSLWWTPAGGARRRLAVRDDAAPHPDASFAQVNDATARLMEDHVLSRVRAHRPNHVVDAYAGAGAGAARLAGDGARVTAIEIDSDAARWAGTRLTSPSRVITARVERALPDALPADVVVLNPPRGGVHARVCATLASATPAPRAIVYVSCDPATLARDLSRLPGWRIASLECFDMFPQTAHVETVCELLPEAA